MNPRRDFRRILLIRRKALGDALVSMRAVLENYPIEYSVAAPAPHWHRPLPMI